MCGVFFNTKQADATLFDGMKYFFGLTFGLVVFLLAFSCSERAVCPAYQSAFIHDKTALDRHFSYFREDSMPKNLLTSSKNNFLIIEKQPYKKKVKNFNTVPVKIIYPVLDDSTALSGDALMVAEMDVVDSATVDSTAVYELPWKEKFNVEQEFYVHYFNDILVYPEERAQAELDKRKKKKKKNEGQSGAKKEKFFKRIFKKKEKKTNDLVDADAPDLDEEMDQDDAGSKKKRSKKSTENQDDTPPVDAETEEEDPENVESSEDDEDDDF